MLRGRTIAAAAGAIVFFIGISELEDLVRLVGGKAVGACSGSSNKRSLQPNDVLNQFNSLTVDERRRVIVIQPNESQTPIAGAPDALSLLQRQGASIQSEQEYASLLLEKIRAHCLSDLSFVTPPGTREMLPPPPATAKPDVSCRTAEQPLPKPDMHNKPPTALSSSDVDSSKSSQTSVAVTQLSVPGPNANQESNNRDRSQQESKVSVFSQSQNGQESQRDMKSILSKLMKHSQMAEETPTQKEIKELKRKLPTSAASSSHRRSSQTSHIQERIQESSDSSWITTRPEGEKSKEIEGDDDKVYDEPQTEPALVEEVRLVVGRPLHAIPEGGSSVFNVKKFRKAYVRRRVEPLGYELNNPVVTPLSERHRQLEAEQKLLEEQEKRAEELFTMGQKRQIGMRRALAR